MSGASDAAGGIRITDEEPEVALARGRLWDRAQGSEEAERRPAQAEAARLEGQWLEAEKLGGLAMAIVGAAHDLKNVLSRVVWYAEVAMEEVDEASPLHCFLERIHNAALLASDLTGRLSASSCTPQGTLPSLSLNAVIESVMRILRPSVPASIAIATELEPRLRAVRADRVGLAQIVLNLVSNAVDAMPEGGTLTIQTERLAEDSPSRAAADGGRPEEGVCLTVADTGIGMDEATVGRIFEPFFSTKAPGKGSGLGLPTVRHIVAQHQGEMSAHSRPGQGSVFRVRLPACCPAREHEGRA